MLFDKLPPRPARKYLSADLDATDWPQLEPVFGELEARRVGSVAELETWLSNQFELAKAIRQAGTTAYIRMTCNTADEAAEQQFLNMTQVIEPAAKPHFNRLNELLLANPHTEELPDHYDVMLRQRRNDVELYREANVPLEAEDSKLDQQHEKIKGAQTAKFDGQERTLIQIGVYLEKTDRQLRQKAYETIIARRLADRDKLDEIFDRQLANRHKRAKNAGFDNFRDYQHRRLGRFDYTVQDCFRFHEAVEKCVVPAAQRIAEERCREMGLEVLRPWDLAVDPQGRAPLEPFAKADELARGCRRIFEQVDPELGTEFQQMIDFGVLDLDNRQGKAPGGYQATLEEYDLPFIFMNAVGQDGDLRTMLHEAGHAFHTFAVRGEKILDYHEPPIEFCEVASMAMELLGNPYLGEFYNQGDAQRSRRTHLEDIVLLLPWIATVDAFQHWLYTHPGHTRQQRNAAWREVRSRFPSHADTTGYEDAEAWLWQKQGHLYGVPFYYIEYGIAQLGALGVWLNAKRNPSVALAKYRQALALGGSRPLPQLFAAAGLSFDMGVETVRPLVNAVMDELEL